MYGCAKSHGDEYGGELDRIGELVITEAGRVSRGRGHTPSGFYLIPSWLTTDSVLCLSGPLHTLPLAIRSSIHRLPRVSISPNVSLSLSLSLSHSLTFPPFPMYLINDSIPIDQCTSGSCNRETNVKISEFSN